MPVWAWILLIAALSVLIVVLLGLIVRSTLKLPRREPLHGDAEEIASPVPLDVAERDSLRERDREAV